MDAKDRNTIKPTQRSFEKAEYALCMQSPYDDLHETARDTLNRQLRSGIDSEQLAQLVVTLRA